MRRLVVLMMLVASIASCGDETADVATDGPDTGVVSDGPEILGEPIPAEVDMTARPTVDPDQLDEPPAVVIAGRDVHLELEPWTTCWSNYCADGAPPADLDQVTMDEPLYVEFPVEGWEFSASIRPIDSTCGASQTEKLDKMSATVFRLPPLGIAGDKAVTVSGRGPGGDVFVTFQWRTNITGVLRVPASSLSLLVDHDGEVDSYGVEFSVSGLASTPETIDASVVVTASDGPSHTVTLDPFDTGCTGEGAAYMDAPVDEGLIAAALGDPPFTYDVTLSIDGQTYQATATWPDETVDECDPCVPLTFDPPLPALNAADIMYEDGSGLRCHGDLYEWGQYDHAAAEPGFESIEAAAEDWWKVGDGRYRADRANLTMEVEDDVITYRDTDGNAQLMLFLVGSDNGWLVSQVGACAPT